MKMYKRIFGVLLCLCMLLGAVSLASAEGEGTGGHSHKLCEGTVCTNPEHIESGTHGSVTFEKALTMNDAGVLYIGGVEAGKYTNQNYDYILPEGTYYLDGDLTLHGGIQVSGSVTLCLNGHAISNDYSHVIQTPWGGDATFTLCDCKGGGKIAHVENSSSTGTGVNLNNTGGKQQAFIMYNGCITQNKGSGVYLYQNTSFTMYGGSITGNTLTDTPTFGGGVYVSSEATFAMYGGEITKNQADYGGGVYVASEASFTMSGGSITKNHAGKIGGGIYSTSDNISIYGGSVTDNSVTKTGKAGGIYVPDSGTLTVGGNVNISGNWQGDRKESGSNSNVYLDYYEDDFATIVIEKDLTGTGSIGITTKTSVATTPNASVKIAAGKGTHAITDADKGHFTPDTGYCEVQKKADGALYLTHVHFGGEATCNAGARCTGCNREYGAPDSTKHSWKDPTYVWNDLECTAKRVCTRNSEHVEEETKRATQREVTQNRTCTQDELATFVVTFTNTAFAEQTKENVKTADALSHNFATTWSSDETNHWHACQREGCQARSDEGGHTGGTATCQAKAKCEMCDTLYGALGEHNFDETKWGYQGTDGHAHKCTNTGCDEHDTVIAHTSSGAATEEVSETCTECGYVINAKLPHSHNWQLVPAAEATCVSTGKTEHYKCTGCSALSVKTGDVYTETTDEALMTPVDADKHDITHYDEKLANCTEKGHNAYDKCSRCSYTTYQETNALGHDFENSTIYRYNGTQHWKKCSRCDVEDTGHKTTHTEVTDEAKPATTTETGLTEGKHCDVCGKVLVAQEVTPKLTPRYYYNSTTTTKDTTKKDNTKSPGTFDPGVGVYALTAVLSVTGMAWVGRKKH